MTHGKGNLGGRGANRWCVREIRVIWGSIMLGAFVFFINFKIIFTYLVCVSVLVESRTQLVGVIVFIFFSMWDFRIKPRLSGLGSSTLTH